MKYIELTDILRQRKKFKNKKNTKEKNELPGGWVKDERDIDIINHVIIPHSDNPIPLFRFMNNGFSTGYFSIERGTRQGDPLSAYIFILCLEILFIQIRNDSSIKGFKFNNIEITLTAFADDTTFLVKDVQSLRRILKLSKTFEIFSSLKFNVEKCEACWIGRSRSKHTKPIQCKWISLTQSCIKILGAHFTYNKQLDEKMNFYRLIIDSRTLLNTWKQRWLSLAGKIQTFKSLIASKPVYIATKKSTPRFVLEELQALHKDFIWGGRRPKIKHSTLIGSYEKGGFKDIDITSKSKSLKGIWIENFWMKPIFIHSKKLLKLFWVI